MIVIEAANRFKSIAKIYKRSKAPPVKTVRKFSYITYDAQGEKIDQFNNDHYDVIVADVEDAMKNSKTVVRIEILFNEKD